MRTRIFIAAAVAAVAIAALLVGSRSGEAQVAGAAVDAVAETAAAVKHYDRLCLACHGATGEGDGPAATLLWPRPRDFTRAEYKWRSTPSGKAPTDADLATAIRYGAPGTSMHSFVNVLGAADVAGLVKLIKSFAPARFAAPAPVVQLAPRPAGDLIAEGKAAYTRLGCHKCHGDTGKGDGVSAKDLIKDDGTPEYPYDLTAKTFRRPRPPGADRDARVAAIYKSLVTGLTGTPMPSFRDTATDRELWAVAAYVETFAAKRSARDNNPVEIDPIATRLEQKKQTFMFGFWPGDPTSPEAAIWGHQLEFQGRAPPSLSPAQRSLSARQCGRCHAKQVREWKHSLHARAASPGLDAQLWTGGRLCKDGTCNRSHATFNENCQRCHNPMAEQLEAVRPAHWGGDPKSKTYRVNPRFDAELKAEGINCASCHVRKMQRHGPPLVREARLLSLPGYPLETLALYERSDFCLACHQGIPANPQVARKPLLNTYREWLEGPYMKRGIQCQHCHMPNREHQFLGIHDPATFREGVDIDAVTRRNPKTGVVSVRVKVTNVGAGHYLPTTPTPAAFVSVELVDSAGEAIEGARAEKRIGRHIEYTKKGWVEHADTRIPPGESLELAGAWRDGRVSQATGARVVLRVEPDEFYERFYRNRLEGKQLPRARALYQKALQITLDSQYVAIRRTFPIETR